MLAQLFDRTGPTAVFLLVPLLGGTAAMHIALRWWLRRHAARLPDPDSATSDIQLRQWALRGLDQVLPAISLLIWTQGLYACVSLLLMQRGDGFIPLLLTALDWAHAIGIGGGLFWLLSRTGRLIETFLITMSLRSGSDWDDLLLPSVGRALRRILPLLAIIAATPLLSLSPTLAEIVATVTSLLLIGGVAVVLFQIVDGVAAFALRQHRIDVNDNLRARGIYTQVVVLKKVALTIVAVFTLSSMLMVFDSVRQFGASILASAGIAGIVVGFAAQRSLATLLAGFQIALTQPFRVDDVVSVDGEFGHIEDVTLTYVVVRIWDLRRLVVPINHFIERPFQNWTRRSANLIGTVFLHVDYTVPMAELRDELTRVLSASRLWDGTVNVLQVTDATEDTLQIRALASAANAAATWDLRCEIREQLVTFLQRQYPASLPRLRASLEPAYAADGPVTATSHPASSDHSHR